MVSWNHVATVLLDMDGTLLDLHFDNHFWHEYVPQCYAQRYGVQLVQARVDLAARYQKVEGSLDWYCVDYWTRELGLDIAALKQELSPLIALHPQAVEFLAAVRARGKRLVLVTNAHGKALAVKLKRTRLDDHFDKIICAHELGAPKEQIAFWERLQKLEPYEATASILVDDSLPVLRAARRYGIGQLVAITEPDSRRPRRHITEFPAIARLAEIMPA